MTIKYVETGKVANVPDAYGARLIEQGKATPIKESAKRPKRKGDKDVAGLAALR